MQSGRTCFTSSNRSESAESTRNRTIGYTERVYPLASASHKKRFHRIRRDYLLEEEPMSTSWPPTSYALIVTPPCVKRSSFTCCRWEGRDMSTNEGAIWINLLCRNRYINVVLPELSKPGGHDDAIAYLSPGWSLPWNTIRGTAERSIQGKKRSCP